MMARAHAPLCFHADGRRERRPMSCAAPWIAASTSCSAAHLQRGDRYAGPAGHHVQPAGFLDGDRAQLLDRAAAAPLRPGMPLLKPRKRSRLPRSSRPECLARRPDRLADTGQAGRHRADPQGSIRRFRRYRRLRARSPANQPARDRHCHRRRPGPHDWWHAGRLRCRKSQVDGPRVASARYWMMDETPRVRNRDD